MGGETELGPDPDSWPEEEQVKFREAVANIPVPSDNNAADLDFLSSVYSKTNDPREVISELQKIYNYSLNLEAEYETSMTGTARGDRVYATALFVDRYAPIKERMDALTAFLEQQGYTVDKSATGIRVLPPGTRPRGQRIKEE